MMTDATGALSATDAARALADLPRYEETLTARAFGLTMMAFGIAVAGLGLTYAFARPWIEANGWYWLFSVLWVPWIAAAATLTATVWRTQAITMGTEEDAGMNWLYTLGLSLLYIALFGVATLVRARTAWDPADPVLDLYVLAVFTAGMATLLSRRHGPGRILTPVFGAAFAILVAALAGDVLGFLGVPASLYGALVGLIAYVAAGVAIAWRG